MTGFYDPIKKNNVPLFSRNSNTSVSGTKSKLDIVKDDCSLFSRLFISCQTRQLDLEEYLARKIKLRHHHCLKELKLILV